VSLFIVSGHLLILELLGRSIVPETSLLEISYKTLRYIRACNSKGVLPSVEQAKSFVPADSQVLFAYACLELEEHDFVKGITVDFKHDGSASVAFDAARITLEGDEYLSSKCMGKVAKTCGKAFEIALEAAVASLVRINL